ncbi:MAG: hypothetical protein PHX72_01755 [Candidatus Shapirobacteria bacterium]|nr:hypothetical protein [Candidatus Shapirobacteria bacterium]
MFKNSKTLFLLFFLLILFFAIYNTSFTSFFSQDDFYHLGLAKIDNLVDFLNFFNPWSQKDVHFRPLGTQVFFLIAHVFPQAWSPIILRAIALIFHLANFYLIFQLLNKFLEKEFLAMVLAGAWLVSPLHFMSIYYISAFQQILAAFWQLLGFWLFVLKKRKWVYFCFILALLSKETALVFPALLLIFSYIIRPEKDVVGCFRRLKREFCYWLPFIFLVIGYGLVRMVTFTHYPGDNYQLSLLPRTLLGSWRWYLTWLVGAPETIIRYAGRLVDFRLVAFIKDSGLLGRIFLGTFLAEVVLICLISFFSLTKKSRSADFSKSIHWWLLFVSFFVISLLPVSFFPYHRYAHYLDLVFFCLLLVGGIYFLKTKLPKILWGLLAAVFLANVCFSVAIDKKLHWTIGRSRIAEDYFLSFEEKDFCRWQSVYFVNSPKVSAHEANIALFNHWGPAYFCHYQPLSVYYQDINPPGDKDQFKIVRIE